MTISPTPSRVDPEPWVAEALAAADRLNQRLQDEVARQELTRRVALEGDKLGAEAGVAASTTARRIVAKEEHARGSRVVLVEGHLATGVQLLREAARARADGLLVVGAVAVTATKAGAELVSQELGAPLVILEASLA